MQPAFSKVKRKRKILNKNVSKRAAKTIKTSEQTPSEIKLKTHSESGSDVPQCSKDKNKLVTPITQSDSDTKNAIPPSKTSKITQRESPPHTHTNMTQKLPHYASTNTSIYTQSDDVNNDMEQDIHDSEDTQSLPPPIIIHCQIKNHKTLVEQIQNTGNSTFTIKYTKHTTNVTIHDREQRIKYMSTLKSKNIEFHTYTDKSLKTHAFVIRGLAEDVTPAEVIHDITTQYHIIPINCHKMKFERYNTKPLMLLITDNTHKLKALQNRLRYILHTKVQIERRRNSRKTVQCHNCQNWGHATSNCHANTRCMHCAGPHSTKTCEAKENSKCANCGSNHTANDPTCDIYTARIKWMEEQQKKNKKNIPKSQYQPQPAEFPPIRHINAPTPSQNYWQNKTRQQPVQLPEQQPEQTPHQVPQHREQQNGNPKPTHTPPTYTGKPPITYQQTNSTLREIMNEFNTLNSLVNLDGMLEAIRALNTQLKESTNTLQTFTIFSKFTQTLDKYNI